MPKCLDVGVLLEFEIWALGVGLMRLPLILVEQKLAGYPPFWALCDVVEGSKGAAKREHFKIQHLAAECFAGSPEAVQRQLLLQEEVRMKETPDASLLMLDAFGLSTWAHHERLAPAGRLLWACGPPSTELLTRSAHLHFDLGVLKS